MAQPNVKQIIKLLKKAYPDAKCSLNFKNPFELIVATILSAQCTDERVNQVTPALFKKFPTPEKMTQASLKEIEELIKSTGFYRSKAKSLLEMSKSLINHHQGKVPQDLESLVKLRGVGRKTANVVLGHAFGIPGLPVDTHVGRLSRRLGLTKQKDPVKIEFDLIKQIPKRDWTIFSNLLIYHGRSLCPARTHPRCQECFLKPYCPQIGV